jgi:Tol biopolymer transport system component
LFFRRDNISQIALVPAAGGPMKILRSLNWVYPKRMDFSPDGRFIVYDSFAKEGSGDRTIFTLSADGAAESKLIDRPGNHLFPLWTADAKRVVFASDLGGTMDLWVIEVAEGKARGEPQLLKRDAGRVLPLGLSRSGQYYYGVRSGVSDVYVTSLDGSVKPDRVTLKFPGRNSEPAFSPDGKSLAYLSRRGTENFGQESRVVVIRTLGTADERELAPALAHLERISWSPDGRSLLVSGSDNKGRGGIYVVDAKTASVKPIAVQAGASFRGFDGVWADSIVYVKDNEVRREDGSVIYRGDQLGPLAVSPDRRSLAVGSRGGIVVVPVSGGEARVLPFERLNDLVWGPVLIAGRGADLWRVPLDGRTPEKLRSPGNRSPGLSLHPDGKRIALTAGETRSEVRMLQLPSAAVP